MISRVEEKFPTLGLWDGGAATGAVHMALDEALLRTAKKTALRWYRWEREEVTFGYPMRWRQVAPRIDGRPAIRRWTGGGIVDHGDDLTISIAVPASEHAGSPIALYERIHSAIVLALGSSARLATAEDCSSGPSCFEHPAPFDVLLADRKIAGGAIRRCREGTLYQGSIQTPQLPADFIPRFAEALAVEPAEWSPPRQTYNLAKQLCATRYDSRRWNEKR